VPLQEFFEKWGFEGLKALRPNEGGGQKPGKSGANCRTRGSSARIHFYGLIRASQSYQ
jgi:hypothetical protein